MVQMRSSQEPDRPDGPDHDLAARHTGPRQCKEYADGSQVTYRYENTISRLSQRIDEKLQVTQYNYNRDDTLSRTAYNNTTVAYPARRLYLRCELQPTAFDDGRHRDDPLSVYPDYPCAFFRRRDNWRAWMARCRTTRLLSAMMNWAGESPLPSMGSLRL